MSGTTDGPISGDYSRRRFFGLPRRFGAMFPGCLFSPVRRWAAFALSFGDFPCRFRALVVLLLLVAAGPFGFVHMARASWIRGSDAVSLADERYCLARPRPPYRIVFYDNARYPVTAENGLPVAVWAHPDFSPLLSVNANPWVGVSVLRAASAEATLADRIYANVQLKLILEEYDRMQQRAREVLEGLALIPLTVDMPSGLTPGSGLSSGGTPSKAGPRMEAPPEESLESKLARLRSAYRQAAADVASGGDSSESGSPSGILLAMTGSPSAPYAGSPSGGTAQRSATAGSESSGGTSGAAAGGAGSPPFDQKLEPGLVPPDLGRPMMASRPLGDEEPLPWLFRAALAVIRFVFAYKVEILASLVFFFAVFWIVALFVTAKRKTL